MSTNYTVVRYFNGSREDEMSSHRTLVAAQKRADRANRVFGTGGWSARIYRGDERVD